MYYAQKQTKSLFFGGGSSAPRSSNMSRMRAHTSISSSMANGDDSEYSDGTINVLSTQTEASMSSTSFSIPRRSTIDADVSSFFYPSNQSIFKIP